MNNKGQASVGAILMLFVTVIVGLALLSGSGGISGQSAALSNTIGIVNETFSLAAVNGFTDRANCVNYAGTPVLINATGGGIVPASNYTFTTRISPTDGIKVLTIQTASQSAYASKSVNASYTCLTQGYAEDSAPRTVSNLVILFACLALAVVIIGTAIKFFKEVD